MLQPGSATISAVASAAIIDRRTTGRRNAGVGMGLNVVIMAAGQGTRMKSARPKVLHTLGGRHLLQHVLDAAAALGETRTIVVTGHGADEVERSTQAPGLVFVRQQPQLGTGHALQQAAPRLDDDGTTLVLNGDVPLIESETCGASSRRRDRSVSPCCTVKLDKPARVRPHRAPADAARTGCDRRDRRREGRLRWRPAIREVYTGVMAAPTCRPQALARALRNDNAAGEFYLTDVVASAVDEGFDVVGVAAGGETEVLGVNSPAQLADLERRLQRTLAERLMAAGVRLADPARFDQRGELRCGSDVEIDVGCIFEGTVEIGDGARIGAYCVVKNARIGAGATIRPYTHIDGEALGASVGAGAIVGPFSRLRGGAVLGADVHVGNFVEIKNSTLGDGAKANHLAYLGDADVGARVNYGAGSITANYDGANKHRTTIGATRTSAATAFSSRRSRSAPARRSAAGRRSTRTRPPAS
jgi:bifunctional UDP-N-acetylglucosamine pyrophosphorylase/glucosamine-1-phosphate N-acetyltransferase